MANDLSPIEQLVYEAVSEIQGIQRDNKQVPDFALLYEVYNFLRPEMDAGFENKALGALRTLYLRGLLAYHLTVNKIPMFGIKQNDNG